MRVQKIRITAWRDARFVPPAESLAVLATLKNREREINVEIETLQKRQKILANKARAERLEALLNELEKIEAQRTAADDAIAAAAGAVVAAARNHARAGSFAYQVLDKYGETVERLVDENGEPLPEHYAHESEVVAGAWKVPEWAAKG